MRVGAADIPIQRQRALVGDRFRGRERDAKDCVGAERRLVVRAVERDERAVEHPLVGRVHSDDRVADLTVHVPDGCGDAFAAVARAAVAKFDGLVRAGARAAGDCRPAPGAGRQLDLSLDGRVAPRIQDFPSVDVFDDAHDRSCGQCCECRRSARE